MACDLAKNRSVHISSITVTQVALINVMAKRLIRVLQKVRNFATTKPDAKGECFECMLSLLLRRDASYDVIAQSISFSLSPRVSTNIYTLSGSE
jgi:hypothetical protein